MFFSRKCRFAGGEFKMANNSNKKLVPEAMTALDKFKYEVASEVGVNLKDGYNGLLHAVHDQQAKVKLPNVSYIPEYPLFLLL